MNRRRFLQSIAGLAALTPIPFALPAAGLANSSARRVLVLAELAGGNDGLNTVVPYADPAYRRLRPALAVPRDQVLTLDDRLGLHSSLAGLMPAWKDGELSVVLGVGYPRPNRSHFRSIDIWETGSDSDRVLEDGWIARALNRDGRSNSRVADAIVLGGGSGSATGGDLRTIVMRDPDAFMRRAERMRQADAGGGNAALRHILNVQGEIETAARQLREIEGRAPNLGVSFPRNPLARQLETAAKLIATDTSVSVIKVSLGGFDTHSRQPGRHAALLKQLGDGLAAFRTAMRHTGDWNRVLVMTYSEFGRRAAQNGSMGTDHGTAAPHFALGGRVRGGLHGSQPSLTDLEGGDLRHRVDFRSLYSTVQRRWWGLPTAGSAFSGHSPLGFLQT